MDGWMDPSRGSIQPIPSIPSMIRSPRRFLLRFGGLSLLLLTILFLLTLRGPSFSGSQPPRLNKESESDSETQDKFPAPLEIQDEERTGPIPPPQTSPDIPEERLGSAGDSRGAELHIDPDPGSIWHPENPAALTHCGKVFGNGFTSRLSLCTPEGTGNGDGDAEESGISKLECFRHEILGADYCTVENLVLDLAKVESSRGGEPIMDVWQRAESKEAPIFHPGSLNLDCLLSKTREQLRGLKLEHWLQFFIPPMQSQSSSRNSHSSSSDSKSGNRVKALCTAVPENRRRRHVFAVFRYEYANLYHTMTDWYNIYQAQRILGFTPESLQPSHPRSPLILLMDGRSWSHMDPVWAQLWGEDNILRLGRLAELSELRERQDPPSGEVSSSSLCFPKLTAVSPGYCSPLHDGREPEKGGPCHGVEHLQEFADWFMGRFAVRHSRDFQGRKRLVTLVARKQYRAHNRHFYPINRKFLNEAELYQALQDGLASEGVEVVVAHFEDMEFKEQLELIARTDVLIGAHGAGLTHALFLRREGYLSEDVDAAEKNRSLHPPAALLELTGGKFQGRQYFDYLTQWLGIPHRKITVRMVGENMRPSPDAVVTEVKKLLQLITPP